MNRIRVPVVGLVVILVGGVLFGGLAAAQPKTFPSAGRVLTRASVQIILVVGGDRPAPEATCREIGPNCDEVMLNNQIDPKTGKVLPVIFERGAPQINAATGLKSASLLLAADPEAGSSRLMSEFRVFVQGRRSRGTIQALSREQDFPAVVRLPVFYGVETGGKDGKLATKDDNFTILAAEPHQVSATVGSIPPDRETCIKSDRYTLITRKTPKGGPLWIRVVCFRFLGPVH